MHHSVVYLTILKSHLFMMRNSFQPTDLCQVTAWAQRLMVKTSPVLESKILYNAPQLMHLFWQGKAMLQILLKCRSLRLRLQCTSRFKFPIHGQQTTINKTLFNSTVSDDTTLLVKAH
jgi:hypothetical protein